MSTREIRKYPNRRLYDAVESRYITLSDIRDLVERKVEFRVTEKKGGNDITCAVLLQVVGEAERSASRVMTHAFLAELIRHFGSPARPALGKYLEDSMQWFVHEHQAPVNGAANWTAPKAENVQPGVAP